MLWQVSIQVEQVTTQEKSDMINKNKQKIKNVAEQVLVEMATIRYHIFAIHIRVTTG